MFVWKRPEINEKVAGDGPFFKKISSSTWSNIEKQERKLLHQSLNHGALKLKGVTDLPRNFRMQQKAWLF